MVTGAGGAAPPPRAQAGSLSKMNKTALLWPNITWVMRNIDADQSRPRTPLTISAHRRDLSNLASTICLLGVPQDADADTSNVSEMSCERSESARSHCSTPPTYGRRHESRSAACPDTLAISTPSSNRSQHINQGININTVVIGRERNPNATVANSTDDTVATQCVNCSFHAEFRVGERYYVG